MTEIHQLGGVVRVLRGNVPANTVPEPGTSRFFGIAEISARGTGEPRYVDPDVDVADPVLLHDGDVVVALLGSIGDATVIDGEAAGAVLGRECVALRVTAPDVLLPRWLCAWMASEECRFQIAQNISGTTMPRLPARALEDFKITFLPLERQREIDELVRHFDAAITESAAALQQLRRLRTVELQLAMAEQEDDRR